MSAITIDGPVVEQLRGASSGTALCDAAGQPIGHVISKEDWLKLQYADAWQRFTDAEIEEMRRRPRIGYTLQEVLEAMEAAGITKSSGRHRPALSWHGWPRNLDVIQP